MKQKGIVISLAAIWLLLTAAAWFGPVMDISLSERRPLAQRPELNGNTLLKGEFMEDFESYTLDQFPLRDGFRTVKSLFHYYVLNQSDNNGIYLAQGMAAQQEYPLNEDSIRHAGQRFTEIYEKYLTDSQVYMAIVPDKGQYLAEESGHLTLHFGKMNTILREEMPWATHVNLYDTLSYEDYYRTDTHWRQEQLLDTAGRLCEALGMPKPAAKDYTVTALEKPFYGVYYGQAALPMEPETIYLMENERTAQCAVFDYETGKTGSVYDRSKLSSRDLYDVYLSGAKSLLTIENPLAATERELIIFRDSFGSAIAPLLIQDYARVTLVDIRYIQSSMLPQYLDFYGQDVLFLYSTLVLNNSSTIK